MNTREYITALACMPRAIFHIHRIRKKLKTCSYTSILEFRTTNSQRKKPITSLTKSYFWASKLFGKDICLARSIALYQGLRMHNFPVEHKIGVCKNNADFAAHAWVEFNNEPLNEASDLRIKFTELEKP